LFEVFAVDAPQRLPLAAFEVEFGPEIGPVPLLDEEHRGVVARVDALVAALVALAARGEEVLRPVDEFGQTLALDRRLRPLAHDRVAVERAVRHVTHRRASPSGRTVR
jgi:hypothetical protein